MTSSALQPRLVIDGAAAAIDFYVQAFGAKEISRYADDRGKIAHAELAIGDASFNLKDDEGDDRSPTTLGGTTVFLCLTIEDIDAVAERMVEAGASVVYPIADHGYGRGGRLRDPFGHVWMLSEPS